ncbi:gamma-glutamyl cyclotransferase gliK [Aspergillus lucknowensis]|uniref:gamma-glutamylcyclotransferase n=1 Tax=Aspergillus lucknowensis TaxID=176173 RepID=A0ABR4LYL4_9EURO
MSLQAPKSPFGEIENHAEGIWYFAYGSNMRSSVMKGRGIMPLKMQAVIVPDYMLCFDIFGIPYAEPAFASIAPLLNNEVSGKSPIPPVHGVAYLLTADDYRRLVVTEGAGVGYDEITVQARVLDSDEEQAEITARTLKAKYPFRPNRVSSKRYMGLILDGAEEFHLPQSYRGFLQSLPVYTPASTYRARLGSWTFLAFWQRAIRALARLTKVSTNKCGHCPRWLGGVIVAVYRFMWGYHDYVHSKIWSRGDGC